MVHDAEQQNNLRILRRVDPNATVRPVGKFGRVPEEVVSTKRRRW